MFVIAGAVLFETGNRLGLMTPVKEWAYEPARGSGSLRDIYPPMSPLAYSIDTFVPLISLNQKDFWLPNPRNSALLLGHEVPAGELLRYYQWFHMLVGWIITTLGVAALTGLLRR